MGPGTPRGTLDPCPSQIPVQPMEGTTGAVKMDARGWYESFGPQ